MRALRRPTVTATIVVVALAAVACTPLPPRTLGQDWSDADPVATDRIPLRDPFVVADQESGWYYMVGTGPGLPMYRSRDLRTWDGPKRTFTPPLGFWGTHRSWAPEIHRYRDAWYMFASFADAPNEGLTVNSTVGTAVLRSEHVDGPYEPISDGPTTPTERFALDGTLVVDDDGTPWIVYAQEHIDPRLGRDGRMAAARLSEDLSRTVGDPIELFAGSDAPWGIAPLLGTLFGFVTDGPSLYRTCDGELLMLWSSDGAQLAYTTGVARSRSGTVAGPWEQLRRPFFVDGGHSSTFVGLDGVVRSALHSPTLFNEHPVIGPVAERDGTIVRTGADTAAVRPCRG